MQARKITTFFISWALLEIGNNLMNVHNVTPTEKWMSVLFHAPVNYAVKNVGMDHG